MQLPLKRRAYIEPAMRTIAGGLIVLCSALIFWQPASTWLCLLMLLFIGLNLFQSGITKFCMMEKLLRRLDFRSELDEIRSLSAAHAEAQARAAFFDTLALLNEVVVELAADGRLVFVSEHWGGLLGRAGEDPAGHLNARFLDFIHPEDRPLVSRQLAGISDTLGAPTSLRFRMLREDRRERWVEGKFAAYRKAGAPNGIRGVLRDVTETYLQERRIGYMAMHDALTGLPNRTFLDEQIATAIEHAAENGTKFALLFIDLDNFKRVNDLHGHKMGDQLLASVSALLRANLRSTDVLARWGGDEFVVLLPFQRDDDIPRRVAGELMRKLQIELETKFPNAYVTLSIGIAIFPTDADTAEALLVQADKALFHAKAQGRNNIQTCADLASSAKGGDAEMAARFIAAIKQNQLQVHYQPVMDAQVPRRIRGVEALVRWHDEKYGWVSPATFIPMAEEMGLINELGRHVLEQALEHFGGCDNRCEGVKLAVNVSKRQLMSDDFYPMLLETLQRYGIRPDEVKLEITESVALEGIDKARVYLQRLSDAGFTLSLDDFGTGFSSLSHLHELPFDEIKIDISFVRRIKTPEGRVLVKTIADMGHAMQLSLVAEGVEDAETAELLRELGVQMLQGYHFSRPMTKEACLTFVAGLKRPELVAVNTH